MNASDSSMDKTSMSTVEDALQRLLDSDEELLEIPEKTKKATSSDRLERAFLEIVEFRRAHGRSPSSTTREIAERKLGARLDGILAEPEKNDALKHLDEFRLLELPEAPSSIDDLLEDDELDLLDDDSGILDTSSLPVRKSPAEEFDVAKRKMAIDFAFFEPLFKIKQRELAEGTFRLIPFPGVQTVKEGSFFVLNGVMLFVAEIGETQRRVVGGKDEQKQRLRVIFENGTESSMYRQSLSIRLHEQDGFALARTGHDLTEIGDSDVATGYIYVLRSLSDDLQIADLPELYKIGFSRGPVEKRVARAVHEPTYLMAPVEIIATYRTYNLKTSTLEHLLHRLFADARLHVSQTGKDGRTYEPSEWFRVPLAVVNQAIDLITSGEIVNYVYDSDTRKLVERD